MSSADTAIERQKKQKKDSIRLWLRRLHLLRCFNYALFAYRYLKTYPANRRFLRQHPDFVPPPAWNLYDATAHVDYEGYYRTGNETANIIAQFIRRHATPDTTSLRILEWGCGLGRCLRHMPALLPGAKLFGSDYNKRSIQWCRRFIPGITFEINVLKPPLCFDDARFDVIFAWSVFTHLSETNGKDWAQELRRVLTPGGLLMLTTRGDNFVESLSRNESEQYRGKGMIAVADSAAEGKKYYLCQHSPDYVKSQLLKGFDVLAHESAPANSPAQDVWLAKRPQHLA